MTQATVGFLDANGNWVPVTTTTGLPTSGGGAAVTSVNSQTGEVVLDATDVGALPDTYAPTWASVTGKPATFTPEAHTHAAADVTSGTFAAARIPSLAISKTSGLQAALDAKQDLLPVAPAVGTFTLQSVDGVLQWTEVV